jgi:7,8-dihydroneopterin aldolase/epimerase/oxygenase
MPITVLPRPAPLLLHPRSQVLARQVPGHQALAHPVLGRLVLGRLVPGRLVPGRLVRGRQLRGHLLRSHLLARHQTLAHRLRHQVLTHRVLGHRVLDHPVLDYRAPGLEVLASPARGRDAGPPSLERLVPDTVQGRAGDSPSLPLTTQDRIELRGMRFVAAHGALPEEAVRPQPFEVDLDLLVDLRSAGRSDALAETVDYGAICEAVRSVMEGPHASLLEHLAEQVADRSLAISAGRAVSVIVTVRKLRPPVPVHMASAAVRITRP